MIISRMTQDYLEVLVPQIFFPARVDKYWHSSYVLSYVLRYFFKIHEISLYLFLSVFIMQLIIIKHLNYFFIFQIQPQLGCFVAFLCWFVPSSLYSYFNSWPFIVIFYLKYFLYCREIWFHNLNKIYLL